MSQTRFKSVSQGVLYVSGKVHSGSRTKPVHHVFDQEQTLPLSACGLPRSLTQKKSKSRSQRKHITKSSASAKRHDANSIPRRQSALPLALAIAIATSNRKRLRCGPVQQCPQKCNFTSPAGPCHSAPKAPGVRAYSQQERHRTLQILAGPPRVRACLLQACGKDAGYC